MKFSNLSMTLLPLAGLLLVAYSTANTFYNGPYKTVTATVIQTSFSTTYTQLPAAATGTTITVQDKASKIYTDWNKSYRLTVLYGYNNDINEQRFQISGRICTQNPWQGGSGLEQALKELGVKTSQVRDGADPGEVREWDYRIWGSADVNFDRTLLGPAVRKGTGCKLPPSSHINELWERKTDNYQISVYHDGWKDQDIILKGKVIHGDKFDKGKGLRRALEHRGVKISYFEKKKNKTYFITATAGREFNYQELEQAICEGGGCGWKPEGKQPWKRPSDEAGLRDFNAYIANENRKTQEAEESSRLATSTLECILTFGIYCGDDGWIWEGR